MLHGARATNGSVSDQHQPAQQPAQQHDPVFVFKAIGGLVLLGALAHCFFCETEDDRYLRSLRERDERAALDKRRDEVKAATCTADTERAATPVVYRFAPEAETQDLAVVYVQPDMWAGLNIDAKTGFAGWAALCKRSKDMISIRDGNSGDTLETWSLEGGL